MQHTTMVHSYYGTPIKTHNSIYRMVPFPIILSDLERQQDFNDM